MRDEIHSGFLKLLQVCKPCWLKFSVFILYKDFFAGLFSAGAVQGYFSALFFHSNTAIQNRSIVSGFTEGLSSL